jgi:hypothetical protein
MSEVDDFVVEAPAVEAATLKPGHQLLEQRAERFLLGGESVRQQPYLHRDNTADRLVDHALAGIGERGSAWRDRCWDRGGARSAHDSLLQEEQHGPSTPRSSSRRRERAGHLVSISAASLSFAKESKWKSGWVNSAGSMVLP